MNRICSLTLGRQGPWSMFESGGLGWYGSKKCEGRGERFKRKQHCRAKSEGKVGKPLLLRGPLKGFLAILPSNQRVQKPLPALQILATHF